MGTVTRNEFLDVGDTIRELMLVSARGRLFSSSSFLPLLPLRALVLPRGGIYFVGNKRGREGQERKGEDAGRIDCFGIFVPRGREGDEGHNSEELARIVAAVVGVNCEEFS